jgi:indolepyruvate ferredoxin oxidoreductase
MKIAQVPAEIRGFGHVKDAAAKTAKKTETALWAKWG